MKATSVTVSSESHWHDLRRQHVGGSEVAVALGVSPTKTRLALWAEKTGKIEPPNLDDNERVFFGRMLESIVAKAVSRRTGLQTRKVRRYMSGRPDIPLGASVDYEITCPERGPGILECKTVDKWEFTKWGDEPPLGYLLQLQAYLLLTGRKWGMIGALVGGNELQTYVYERRLDTARLIENGVNEFWHYVDNSEPPPVMDYAKDARVISKLYASVSEDRVADLDDDLRALELCAAYRDASETEKQAKARKDAARAELLTILGDAPKGVCEQYKISAGLVAATPDRLAKPGEIIKGRSAYRNVRISERW